MPTYTPAVSGMKTMMPRDILALGGKIRVEGRKEPAGISMGITTKWRVGYRKMYIMQAAEGAGWNGNSSRCWMPQRAWGSGHSIFRNIAPGKLPRILRKILQILPMNNIMESKVWFMRMAIFHK